jgi:Tol biopolymer transport system component/DNA-binding winged helix-turn-helix (wHTH) protein
METPKATAGHLAFDRFEVDLTSGHVLKNGRRIRLQPQPFRMLELMLQRPGELITREEVCRALWNSDTFVEFDHSLATAVNKIREALDDSAENPKFVETIPRRGYRFIGQLRLGPSANGTPLRTLESAPAPPTNGHASTRALAQASALPWVQTSIDAIATAVVRPTIRRATSIIAITALATAAVFLALRWSRSGIERSFADIHVVPFTSLRGDEMSPAFSPDGSRIAFGWNGDPASGTPASGATSGAKGYDLYVKALGNETVLRLTSHPSEWISPTWSPDGTEIAFHRMDGADTGIYVVSALGGPERKLRATHIPYNLAAPLSWSRDGKWIAYGDASPNQPGDRMFLVSPTTLEVVPIPHQASCLHEAVPTFSHRGDKLVYVCVRSLKDVELDSVVPFKWQPITRLTGFVLGVPGMAWTPDDQGLVFSHASDDGPILDEFMFADGSTRRLTFAQNAEWPAISPVGDRIAYSSESDKVNIYRKDLAHPRSPALALSSTTREQENPQYSPDGKRIAFASSRGGSREIWMSDIAGTNLLQLSALKGYATRPQWSPDGRKIVFGTHQGDNQEIFVIDVAEGVPRRVETNVKDISMPSWSHDGKWIYFRAFETLGHKIYRCPSTGGEAEPLHTSNDATSPQESPDGAVLYYTARSYNTALIALPLKRGSSESAVEGMPAINDENQWVVVPGGVYFVPAQAPRSVYYFDFATKKSRVVFESQMPVADGLSLSPDGRWLLYSQTDEENTDIMLADHFR